MSIQLSKRLYAIAGVVPSCSVFYDIGTDHGMLPAFLLNEGRCRIAAPCDVSPDSLDKARRLFGRYGLTARARFICRDGLTGLEPEPGDCVAICGLGARTIMGILRSGLCCPLVVSTHVEVELLRDALPGLGYRIEYESLVRERRRYYIVLRVVAGEDAPYIGADAYIGRGLRGDPLLADYLAWRERIVREAAIGGEAIWNQRLKWIEEAKAWL